MSQFVWVCPLCARRVPNRLDVCRCGAPRGNAETVEASAAPPVTPAGSGPIDPAVLLAISLPRSPRRPPRLNRIVLLAVAGTLFLMGLSGFSFFLSSSSHARPVQRSASAKAAVVPASEPALPELPPLDEPPPAAVPVLTAAEPMALLSTEEIVSRSMPAVVTIETRDGLGSGFFVAPAIVVTNAHVVRGSSAVTLKRTGGYSRSAQVDEVSDSIDLAIVRVDLPDLNQVILPLAASSDVHVGAEVVAIGSPLGLANTVTRGIVSGMRDVQGVKMIQTDAAINPGNSGGPLLDRYGRVLGVNTMKLVTRGVDSLAFAVSIEYVRQLLGPKFVPKTDQVRQREDAVREYGDNVRVLAQQADVVDRNWKKFSASCGQPNDPPPLERGWFSLWDGRQAPTRQSPSCRSWHDYFSDAAVRTRDNLRRCELAARVAGMAVDEMRTVRRRYAMDFAEWEP
jgi:S1-C subfamily serine protease